MSTTTHTTEKASTPTEQLTADEKRAIEALTRRTAFDLDTLPDFEVYCVVGEFGVTSVENALEADR